MSDTGEAPPTTTEEAPAGEAAPAVDDNKEAVTEGTTEEGAEVPTSAGAEDAELTEEDAAAVPDTAADDAEVEARTLQSSTDYLVESIARNTNQEVSAYNILQCVEWVRDVLNLLPGYRADLLDEEQRMTIVTFLTNPNNRRLAAWMDGGLRIETSIPTEFQGELMYFIRDTSRTVSYEQINSCVQFGTIAGAAMDSLLRQMNSVFVPTFMHNTTWPESFKKEFSGQLHKFMASLTETAHSVKGSTVLYVPNEDLSEIDVAAKQKDLVQRLESTLIHWTRQIKAVINDQENSEHAEDAGPLSEIQFWRSRFLDLSGIREQLNRPGVQTIVAVLNVATSSYLQPFQNLANRIEQGSQEAQENLQVLSPLQAPCEKLAVSEPKDIASMLPHILNCIRMIWNLSKFYHNADRITGLLRKVSNEIIERCCSHINLKQIFDGNGELTMPILRQSIESGDSWKAIYHKTASGPCKWQFDESRIFAQIDAFVTRCKDLLEVCEWQIQFSHKDAGAPGSEKAELPVFGGSRGPEIRKSLLDIQASFERYMTHLRNLNYDILDVKATKWHDDYNAFKNGVKDLEVMMQNVISSSFDGVASVANGVEIQEAFHHLANRYTIKSTVENKTAYIVKVFIDDLNVVKKEFDTHRKHPPLHHSFPRYAGAAYWAKGLLRRIQRESELLDSFYHIASTTEAENARLQYQQLSLVLDDYIKKAYAEWMTSVEAMGTDKALDNNLMIQTGNGNLELAFDKNLLRLINEVRYWERLHFSIPYTAIEKTTDKDRLRILREHVMLVVRDYNRILNALSPQERRLFLDKIKHLDRKINPGLVKLTWSSKGIMEYYVKDCRKHCKSAEALVTEFKSSKERIFRNCRLIADTLLVKIEKKKIYEEGQFELAQQEHRDVVKKKLKAAHDEIKEIMKNIFKIFGNDSDEVLKELKNFIVKTDKSVEDSLRQTVKRSLQEISRAINGDKKVEVNVLFKVNVILDTQSKVEYKPSMSTLTQMVNYVSKELITVLSVVPRLQDVVEQEVRQALQEAAAGEDRAVVTLRASKINFSDGNRAVSFYDGIANDEEILKIMVSIMSGMSSSVDKLNKYLTFWEKYKHVWEYDKDAFMRRYARANRPLASFDADVVRYRDLQAEVQNEESVVPMNFISIDCSPLKSAIVGHCMGWQKKFTTLLNDIAYTELKALHDMFQTNTEKLSHTPSNLDQLGKILGLLKGLQNDIPTTEGRFAPLQAQYRVLEKFEVNVKEEELNLLANIPAEWDAFRVTLSQAEANLAKCKKNMKSELERQVAKFETVITTMREEFMANAPFSADYSVKEASTIINDFRAQVSSNRQQEAQMQQGLDIFEVEKPLHTAISSTAKDLDLLEQVWKLTEEWNESWDSWKYGQFKELKVDEMEDTAQKFVRRVQKLKEIKHWGVHAQIKERVEQFRRTMPLILDLKSPAMRSRHWNQLKEEIGKDFDENSSSFTLEQVSLLGLDQFAETIANLSGTASKELAIEKQLADIEEVWRDLTLDIVPYKDKGHYKLRSAEEVVQNLDDHQVNLSTMKASRHYESFSSQVEELERTLTHISETVDMILSVQRQWMYLENIFSSDDIRKQLQTESSIFEAVNSNWKFKMERLYADPNARRGTHTEGLLEELVDMNVKLENIQKQLESYLETKRKAFPRFYFLSNDDLLEILGQAKDPQAVQPHLKKCFEAIKTLKLEQNQRKVIEASGMNSPEGEWVPFQVNVPTDGAVELWLVAVEAAMRLSLRKILPQALQAMRSSKREKWVREWAGQLLITASQIQWTSDCEKALAEVEKGNKNGLKRLKMKQVSLLNKLSDLVRSPLPKLDRNKINALLTIEVHARDVIDKMIKANCNSTSNFEWMSQLRFYWDKDEDMCIVRQTRSRFEYGNEYLGNNGRLVITPLTDRCYLTLTTAIQLNRGGNPLGPAGTGKTETVKDLGKAVAKYVIVFNCSDGLDYRSMERMFSGLAQTGAWSCFDEFNRIDIEVLSVVAQQITCVLDAVRESGGQPSHFDFQGQIIKLDPTCGIFVTMNPGYAGRTELPDNLKALFRPISMMVPDSALIAEIMLFCEGFQQARPLSKKLTLLYSLAIQQLSKQDHYDFGLRAIKSALVAAGGLKRSEPDLMEDMVVFRTLRDANVPKLVVEDVRLFTALLGDLFPGMESTTVDYGALQVAIEAELREAGLQANATIVRKAIQLYETKCSRHGNMLVGKTGSGKSTAWTALGNAMSRLNREGNENYQSVKWYVINPKSLDMNELYGGYILPGEWTDGVLSNVMRSCCADEKPSEKWIVLDGPVDTLWIESMNTVLDDNKLLTLISGERISMPPQVSLLFEVEDLAVASPATVSRAGMVYLDVIDLGWEPYVETWLEKRPDQDSVEHLKRLFTKYIPRVLEFKASDCVEPVPITNLNAVKSLCHLFEALATPENGVSPAEGDNYARYIEMWFVFSLVWSVCAAIDEESRKRIDMLVREIEAQFPSKNTVFDYYIDIKKNSFVGWEDKVPNAWRPLPDTPFYRVMVPTVDTVRNSFILSTLVQHGVGALVVGGMGTGKTSLVSSILQGVEKLLTMTMNFSAQTSSVRVQEIVEGRVEKRTTNSFAPPGGKKMVCFIDDLNMPTKDMFGSQPAIELLRHWLDYGFWYDRKKQTVKYIKDTQLCCAMGFPGGGRAHMTKRMQSRFHLLNFTMPAEAQIKRIFGTLLTLKLLEFDDEIKPIGDVITEATVSLYQVAMDHLLPTPTKSHYVFNLRDLSKVLQGCLKAHRDVIDSKDSMTRLWVHECFRVFSDRLVDDHDKTWFRNMLDEKIASMFESSLKMLFRGASMSVFGDFMAGPDAENPPYEEVVEEETLKKFMEEQLEDYNAEPGNVPMSLVLFQDAIQHLCRIHRIIRQPRGNALLVGVGGSGRQSLTRLATFISGCQLFVIEITKQYRHQEFHVDLRKLYMRCGAELKKTVFMFNDTQIVNEGFLEDINNMLSSGEVPNLFPADELQAVRDAVRADAKANGHPETNDALFSFFVDRARENMHIVLCMSPIGDAFRNRCRMFPALVNCTTIDWFSQWPNDALKEVAAKFLEPVDLQTPEIKQAVVDVLVTAHSSVAEVSQRMLQELKRVNYVTPTNYLEMVTGYMSLLAEKRKQIGDAASKLRNGLNKLDEGKVQVETMSVELEAKKIDVTTAQTECEQLLVVIMQEKRTVDEQQKQVTAEAEKIGKEEVTLRQSANDAQQDLDKVMPVMEEALKALETLNKKDISEVKAYTKPPDEVVLTLSAVLVLLKRSSTEWAEARKLMSDSNFINMLKEYPKETLNDSMLTKLGRYTSNPLFDPDRVGGVSFAAKSLCMWCLAMERYGQVNKVVAPKKAKLQASEAALATKQDLLRKSQQKLQEVTDKVAALNQKYDDSVATKSRLKAEMENLEIKLERAEKLVSGLAGERVRWEASIEVYEGQQKNLVGDCVLAAAFLSYAGPFNGDYRSILVDQTWMPLVHQLTIPMTSDFTFSFFLSKPTEVREWNLKGLPTDSYSTENGVLITRGRRWPLVIDPQGQANRWIKNFEGEKGLKVVDLKSEWMRVMENAIVFGTPVLMEDVQEELDPALEPVLAKSLTKVNNRWVLRLGEKELEYNQDFRFYLTTKMNNPHYPPEISTKTTLVNSTVRESGLEDQLLGTVVKKERPDLEKKKQDLVTQVAESKNTLAALEDKILYLLSSTSGSLLDDESLTATLQSSKVTSEEVKQQLVVAEQTEKSIDVAREGYRPSAFRASLLYFVLNDMSLVDPMYQFSLETYTELFSKSIDKSPKNEDLKERLNNLNDYHTLAVYRNTCRGLFERHKLLFAFQMCIKILSGDNKIINEEYQFFLRGGQVLNKDSQPPNPATDWITETSWDNISELDKLTNFRDIIASFEQNSLDWRKWYTSAQPDQTPLIGEWENKCSEFQRLILVRCIRPDRVVFAATTFIINNLGPKFVEPPAFDLAQAHGDSTCTTPLIFVLSPGVDPAAALTKLAGEKKVSENLRAIALGQGQSVIAERLIAEGVQEGHWVFLANCHLSISWMPTLEKLVERLSSGEKPHDDFRLWLSSSPHPQFPVSILQKGIKMTTEPPKGLRANLSRLYSKFNDAQFNRCLKPARYKKLCFALVFFHSVLLERRKFLTLGWNIPYDFNESDFEISENIMQIYLDSYDEIPWDALKYLIADANYGGRVTDEWDRRLLLTYMRQYFCVDAVQTDNFRLSSLSTYVIPEDGSLQSYRDYINLLPTIDDPEAFGQHSNADINSQIQETNTLLETIVALQPAVVSEGGETREDVVFKLATDMLAAVPNDINLEETIKLKEEDPSPLNVVLLQEIARYNLLLVAMRAALTDVTRGIRGLVVMSSELDVVFGCLFDGKVPPSWQFAYPSVKGLGAWTRDLGMRITTLQAWAEGSYPKVYWLGGFTFPTGFLTALMQTSARKNNLPIDSLAWDFTVINQSDEKDITQVPREGAYIKGMFLEGASWDLSNGCLAEQNPMELVVPMPIVHFKPIESKKKQSKGIYSAPCYFYPIRTGTRERPSFILAVDLKSGNNTDADFWTRRGTALLLSLAV